ncbi:alpha-L-rhamnosidase C-terminal domain-containing protein [Spirosoma panaciterrae]|uniref:alpha-L-rhamnosidase-related protein n=1 Tax=Spirosoma panaciterrae TaxID=496058 RepID=UPI0003673D61|nr:alpha-L-rhamnosidase C-terminal domain-containing protein [Spirosoma panaciterrae]
MRHWLSTLLLLTISSSALQAQIDPATLPKSLVTELWPAHWIAVPGTSPNGYGVYHFRKTIQLTRKPGAFIVHVSGDNRYKLFVNGRLVSLGPSRSDVRHWSFETVDLAPYLVAGSNTLAAVVWNFGPMMSFAQHSLRTGLIVQGNGPDEQIANTNSSWKCLQNGAYTAIQTNLYTFFQVGPGEHIQFSQYPWDWESATFRDANWTWAQEIKSGSMWNLNIDFDNWTLTPRPIPPMELKPERLVKLRRAEGITVPAGFPEQAVPLRIPAQSRVVLLLDQTYLTTAYPMLRVSGGRAAQIELSYAESLFEPAAKDRPAPTIKADRNAIDGKVFWGGNDVFVADGGQQRSITTLWWRTYRYLQITIKTQREPLVINDLSGLFTAYPLAKASTANIPESPELTNMLNIGWRTVRLCANETYMDCPYYEQLQYAGDVRIQALITLYNSTDDRLVRQAITQLRQSLSANGLTMSRYPSREPQYIPTFSLWWISMLHDYWRYRGDKAFIQESLPVTRMILNYFTNYQHPDGSLKRFPDWPFTDWTTSSDWQTWGSVAPYTENGNSAPLDLQLLLAYEVARDLEAQVGMSGFADLYAEQSRRLKHTIQRLYWDKSRALFTDTPQKRHFSQHTNMLAVLTGVVKGDSARQLMERTLTDRTLVQPSIFYRYYLHRAVAETGLGDQYLNLLGLWREQMKLGLTTWAESHEPSRSDCHAWGSSPNIEFYRIILGIDSDAPGFEKVRITPNLGNLHNVSGQMPHPKGVISVSYTLSQTGTLRADINLPEGVTGTFRWKGQQRPLTAGHQLFDLTVQ